MMLDYHFKTFLVVCESKNYTEAAQKLQMTQPAISRQMEQLQEQLQLELITINNRKMTLTKEGKYLYRLISSMKNMVHKKLYSLTHNRPQLLIGATPFISQYLLEPLLTQFLRDNKTVSINLYVENTPSLLKKLQLGALDCALIEGDVDPLVFDSIFLRNELLLPICATQSKLAHHSRSLADLITSDLIIREPESTIYHEIKHYFAKRTIALSDFHAVNVVEDSNLIKQLIRSDWGIGFLYKHEIEKEVRQQSLCPLYLDQAHIVVPLNFVYLSKKQHTQAIHTQFDLSNYKLSKKLV